MLLRSTIDSGILWIYCSRLDYGMLVCKRLGCLAYLTLGESAFYSMLFALLSWLRLPADGGLDAED